MKSFKKYIYKKSLNEKLSHEKWKRKCRVKVLQARDASPEMGITTEYKDNVFALQHIKCVVWVCEKVSSSETAFDYCLFCRFAWEFTFDFGFIKVEVIRLWLAASFRKTIAMRDIDKQLDFAICHNKIVACELSMKFVFFIVS